MYFVYVLKSLEYKKSYVGYTENLEKRLQQHNEGKSFYTNKFKPWKIIYTEHYATKVEAIQKEKYFKTHAGRIKLKEIFKQWEIV